MIQLRRALSIRQPWAALIVHGVKAIEIRKWCTTLRGPILIHASKQPEPDPAAWSLLASPQLMEAASLIGGIIGMAELWDCKDYCDIKGFLDDSALHFAGPERFRLPVTYGFCFRNAKPLPFHPCPGNTGFFLVPASVKSFQIKRKQPRHNAQFIVQLPEAS